MKVVIFPGTSEHQDDGRLGTPKHQRAYMSRTLLYIVVALSIIGCNKHNHARNDSTKAYMSTFYRYAATVMAEDDSKSITDMFALDDTKEIFRQVHKKGVFFYLSANSRLYDAPGANPPIEIVIVARIPTNDSGKSILGMTTRFGFVEMSVDDFHKVNCGPFIRSDGRNVTLEEIVCGPVAEWSPRE